MGLHDVDVASSASTTRSTGAARASGDALFQCWAEFDTILMEEVVPFAPYLFDNSVDIISDNVLNYSFDQFAGLAAFDQLAVATG